MNTYVIETTRPLISPRLGAFSRQRLCWIYELQARDIRAAAGIAAHLAGPALGLRVRRVA